MKFKLIIESISINEIKKLFLKYSKMYFPDYHGKFPLPEIKLKILKMDHGKYITSLEDPPKNILIINKEILYDKETLKSVLLHEMIHYYVNWIEKMYLKGKAYNQLESHGEIFHKFMNMINKKEGKEVISLTSDFTPKSLKKYYVYFVIGNNNVSFGYSIKGPEKEYTIKAVKLKAEKENLTPYYVITDNGFFKNAKIPITPKKWWMLYSFNIDKYKDIYNYLNKNKIKIEI